MQSQAIQECSSPSVSCGEMSSILSISARKACWNEAKISLAVRKGWWKLNKLKLFFTIDGQRKYWKGIYLEFKDGIRRGKNSFKKQNTYHEMLLFFSFMFLLMFLLKKQDVYSKLTIISIGLLLVNYMIKNYRFGSKGYQWFKE